MTRSSRTAALAEALVVIALAAATPAAAANIEEAAARLEAIGMRVEGISALPPTERPAALESAARSLEDIMRSLPEAQRPAAQLLAGEVFLALGRGAEAGESFRAAEKDDHKHGLEDDALLGRVRALELEGRDAEADELARKWLDKHENSALAPEVRLARAWNALRRDALGTAQSELEHITTSAPWMRADPRFVLACATLDWRQDRSQEALSALDSAEGPAATYLRALCAERTGAALKAAAAYQEVAVRWPESPLRDPALIAKADIFLAGGAWRAAAEEYGRVAGTADRADVRAEAELRRAACLVLDGDTETGIGELASVAERHHGTNYAARAHYLRGEALWEGERYEEAIAEYNRVLTEHFEHELAASAQYRVGRSLDLLGRGAEATSAYRAVVSGYPLAAESPAAAYLAGVGLLDQERPIEAAPYFQIVLDRYASEGSGGSLEFSSPEYRELVEAALCLLETSYWRAGRLGELCGAPHALLERMPPSDSAWRGAALLVDADALASQARYDEARIMLEKLLAEFPGEQITVTANRLLAWVHARQGNDALAIETERRMLDLYRQLGDVEALASASLHEAHIFFNEKKYDEAAAAYDGYLAEFPEHGERLLALWQAGLTHERSGRTGDAVDRWETLVTEAPSDPLAERAWARAGDLYFRYEHYDDAKRCFHGLLEYFADTPAAARGELRIAQCDYNAGDDAAALERFAKVATTWPGSAAAQEAERGLQNALYRLGRSDGGTEVLAQLVEEHPQSAFAADAQFEIARRLYEAKSWPEAVEALRRVVTQFPGYSAADRAQYLLGDALAESGDARGARESWEQFLFFFPTSALRPAVQFRLASARFAEGDWMQAAVDFTAVLEAKTSEETRRATIFNLALCHDALGRPDEAAKLLARYRETAPAGDPRVGDAAYRLGVIHETAGRDAEAVREYTAALAAGSLQTQPAELHWRLGGCHERLGERAQAIQSYRKVVEGAERGSAVRLPAAGRLAALHEERGETKEAIAAYRNLLDADDPELIAAAKNRIAELGGSN
jgi:tetratricopeptide (TPR) repeat protein